MKVQRADMQGQTVNPRLYLQLMTLCLKRVLTLRGRYNKMSVLAFSQSNFDAESYLANRPTYTEEFYDRLYAYHTGNFETAVDIGCGPGLITSQLAKKFKKVYGVDTSERMLSIALKKDNIEYTSAGSAESLPFLADSSVDLVTVGQAAHWFRADPWFTEMSRILKPGGTLSFVSYNEMVFKNNKEATEIVTKYTKSGDKLGPYWPQPGRALLESALEGLDPPLPVFQDQTRQYALQKGNEDAAPLVEKKFHNLDHLMQYVCTWSAVHEYMSTRSLESSSRSLIDHFQDELKGALGPTIQKMDVQWPSVLVMARAAKQEMPKAD